MRPREHISFDERRNTNKKMDGKYILQVKNMPIGSDNVTWEPSSFCRFNFLRNNKLFLKDIFWRSTIKIHKLSIWLGKTT